MDFALSAELVSRFAELDAFIAAEIRPLQQQDDNERFFDHRREFARTDSRPLPADAELPDVAIEHDDDATVLSLDPMRG